MKINLIQDIATPHNNVLISELLSQTDVTLNLWYAVNSDTNLYQWTVDLTNEHKIANIYGTSFNWRFIKYCLLHRDEKYIIVGWANINTMLLTFLFFLLRRPFNHWTDIPDSHDKNIRCHKIFFRWIAYQVLKNSKSLIFSVGITTIKYFLGLGFSEKRLINLPIFVEVNNDLNKYKANQSIIFTKFGIRQGDFLITSGSRIVKEKGYDLLINAVSKLKSEIKENLKVIIVGSGPNLDDLKQQVFDLRLSKQIIFIEWLPIDDFKLIIANSEIFIHPARIDSYGGTTLGMSMGVPVIGSFEAGAAIDRISSGVNGFLYHAEDINSLSNYISLLYELPILRKKMASEAYKTALQWPPSRGVEIIINNSI